MATSIRSYIQPPRKSAPETDVPTLKPGRDPMPTRCDVCASGLVNIEPPLGIAPFGIASCGMCGTVLAHIERPVTPIRPPRTPEPLVGGAPSRPERDRDWRLPGCNSACFGG